LPRAGDAEDGDRLGGHAPGLDAPLDDAAGDDVDAGVRDDVHHHRDLLHAGLGEDQLGELAGLLDARVAADLAVVRGPPAVLADGVEERERSAARADHEPEITVELAHVAGDTAVIGRIHLRAANLELGRGPRLARLLFADAELLQQRSVLVARVTLEVDV